MATMSLSVALSVPTAFAPNFAGLMVLRFLQGFFGSPPCLASGGASLGDMNSMMALRYALVAWMMSSPWPGAGLAMVPLRDRVGVVAGARRHARLAPGDEWGRHPPPPGPSPPTRSSGTSASRGVSRCSAA
ncbi:hypothetical protein J3459_016314 [Metarhizium acridum]|nr:hypothetical protein J3459_016314 [Metarhizium acridum]